MHPYPKFRCWSYWPVIPSAVAPSMRIRSALQCCSRGPSLVVEAASFPNTAMAPVGSCAVEALFWPPFGAWFLCIAVLEV